MARAMVKLASHGNSVGVNIPRQMLIFLGWLPGERMIVELTESRSIVVRRPTIGDVAPEVLPGRFADPVPLGDR